ncbi:NADP-dependent oxidoreductase domain-containing protein [Mycena maculata]|uniref:NADP-dependent oxidoreductase domain-containing protein n=1 Tax=Mycena maculata TaxID=230809 RepID=A0AAD7NSH5_9AGAR|nr:NADP-dependent oxidoreductase domain-containing protein [Mycena maculata]
MPFGEVTLNDGKKIPAIAFGTGSIYKHTDVTQLVNQALEAGFNHIDTAAFYETEQYVGQVIHESGLARSDLYITTKYGLGKVQEGIRKSLSNLGLKYVDLYLIHQPTFVPDIDGTWKEFETIRKDGLAKSIGVSNFTLDQLQSLVKGARVRPAVNQIELHPYNYAAKKPLIEWSAQHGIVTEAYSSLSSITKFPGGPVDAPVAAAAARLGISPTQVLLSWVRAKGAVIVTTTSSKDRLQEYLAVGDLPSLPAADVAAIDEAGAKGPPGVLSYEISVRGRKVSLRTGALAAFLFFVAYVFFRVGSCGMRA